MVSLSNHCPHEIPLCPLPCRRHQHVADLASRATAFSVPVGEAEGGGFDHI